MTAEQELREAIRERIRQSSSSIYCSDFEEWINILTIQILSLLKELYPIMYQEEAEFIGWLLDRGWIPPGEAQSYRKVPDKLPDMLAENQELPVYPCVPYTGNDPDTQNANELAKASYLQAQQDMFKAGWRLTVPLVGGYNKRVTVNQEEKGY